MKATIDIPDDLYRRVKARTAQEGRRIRDVTAALFRKWLDEPESGEVTSGVPVVTATQLYRHHDVESLQKAYPRGYRLAGPLVPSTRDAPVIIASTVDRAVADMDNAYLTGHARAH